MAAKSSSPLIWSNCLAFVVMVIVNGVAGSTTLIGGKLTSEVSDAYPTLITPSGYVFAIWGLIYVLLGIFVVFQALPRNRDKPFIQRIAWLFLINCALNVSWLFAWQYGYLSLSVILMFLLLASLILIYVRLEIGKKRVERKEWLAVHLPFSTYLGWITIATFADVSVTLVSLGWDGFGIGPETWAIIIALVALAIAVFVVLTRKDLAYGLVIIWAFVGIAVKQSSNQTIVALMLMGAIIVVIALSASLVFSRARHLGRSAS